MKELVFLTGGSSGVGGALLKLFLENNYYVINVSRREPSVPTHLDRQLLHISCDLTDKGFYNNLFNRIEDFKLSDFKLKGYVHCAGVGQKKKLSELTIDEIENTIDLNLTSGIIISKMLIPRLDKTSSKIFFLGSRSRRFAFSGGVAYSSSKSGLFSVVDCMALEFRESKWNIGVTLFEFGTIGTGFASLPISSHQISVEGAAGIIFRSFLLPLSDFDQRVVEVVPSVERFACTTVV